MIKPFHAFVGYRPQRAVRSESEITELRIPFLRLAWRRVGLRSQIARDPAKPLIVRKPNRTIGCLMQESIAGRRAVAMLVLLELRLAPGQKQEWTFASLHP